MPTYYNMQDRDSIRSSNPHLMTFRDPSYATSNVLKSNKLQSWTLQSKILIDDPTYLGFKVEFGVFGASLLQDDIIASMFCPPSMRPENQGFVVDYAQQRHNSVLMTDYDEYPMGLLNNNFGDFGTESEAFAEFMNQDGYSAVKYLWHRNDDRRVEYLKTFIELLYSIQRDHQYVFTRISGISGLLRHAPERGSRVKDCTITIDCIESLDLRIKTLMQLYRAAAWDDAYQRWVLPDILRQFRMMIYVADVRELQTVWSKGVTKAADLVEVPMFCLECAPCEFEIPGDVLEDTYQSTYHSSQPTTKLKIKVKNVRVYETNDILGKFEDIYIADMFNAKFRTELGDKTSPENIAYYWLSRNFFLDTYNSVERFHDYNRSGAPKIAGSEIDSNGKDYYGDYMTPASFVYSAHKWLYRHSIRNYLFYSGVMTDYDAAYKFLENVIRKWLGYKPKSDESDEWPDLGNDILQSQQQDVRGRNYTASDIASLLNTIKSKMSQFNLDSDDEKNALAGYLSDMLDMLKNNKIYYNNIIKDTRDDRSQATDLDGEPDVSGLVDLDTSMPIPAQAMAELMDVVPDASLNPPVIEEISPAEELSDPGMGVPDASLEVQGLDFGKDPVMRFIDTSLLDNPCGIELKQYPLSGKFVGHFRAADLKEAKPRLDLDDPGLEEPVHGVPLEDPGLEGGYVFRMARAELEDPSEPISLTPQPLQEPEPGDPLRDPGLDEIKDPIALSDMGIVGEALDLQIEDYGLEGMENGGVLEDGGIELPVAEDSPVDARIEPTEYDAPDLVQHDMASLDQGEVLANGGLIPGSGIRQVADYGIGLETAPGAIEDPAQLQGYVPDKISEYGMIDGSAAMGMVAHGLLDDSDLGELKDPGLSSEETECALLPSDLSAVDSPARLEPVELAEVPCEAELVDDALFGGYDAPELKQADLAPADVDAVLSDAGLDEAPYKRPKIEDVGLSEPPALEHEIKDVKLEEIKDAPKFAPLTLTEAEKSAIVMLKTYLEEPEKVTSDELVDVIDGVIAEHQFIDSKLEEVAASMDMTKGELIDDYRRRRLDDNAGISSSDIDADSARPAQPGDLGGLDKAKRLDGDLISTEFVSTATGAKRSLRTGDLVYDDGDRRSIVTDKEIHVDDNAMHQLEIRMQKADKAKSGEAGA